MLLSIKARLCLVIIALLLCASVAPAQQLAFPTAEGFGRFSQGGRGGKVYHINSLTWGTGSGGSCNAGGCGGAAPFSAGTVTLMDCLRDRFGVGARTCIFRVGGIITGSCTDFECNNNAGWPSYITIAGQTAPGDGIVVRGIEMQFRNMHDVIVRHLRVYSGAGAYNFYTQHGNLEFFGPNADTYNGIVDHCTFAWAPDDSMATDGNIYNLTFQHNVLAEGMGFDTGTESDSGKCGIQATNYATGGISWIYNFAVNTVYRCPNVYGGYLQIANNLYYNTNATMQILPRNTPVKAEFTNNYIHPGPNTQPGEARVQFLGCGYPETNCTNTAASVAQLNGNLHTVLRTSLGQPDSNYLLTFGSPTVAWQTGSLNLNFPALPSFKTAANVPASVLANAGARKPTIDPILQRQLNDYNTCGNAAGTGCSGRVNFLDEDNIGGYPTYNSGTPYTDTDGDGISDSWETAHGLNPNNAADGPALATGQPAGGYTNLEVFLNELAGDTPATADITSNLIAHYKFNDGAGTATDSTGLGHAGTLVGSPTYGSGPPSLGTALALNGTTQAVTVADANDLDIVGAYTLAAWVRPSSTLTTWAAVLVKNYVYYLYAGSSGICGNGGILAGHGGVNACFSTPLTANTWAHVAATYDGATIQLYVNGSPVASVAQGTAPIASANSLQIGTSQFNEWFPGSLDEVRLYSRALTATEIGLLAAVTDDTVATVPVLTRIVR